MADTTTPAATTNQSFLGSLWSGASTIVGGIASGLGDALSGATNIVDSFTPGSLGGISGFFDSWGASSAPTIPANIANTGASVGLGQNVASEGPLLTQEAFAPSQQRQSQAPAVPATDAAGRPPVVPDNPASATASSGTAAVLEPGSGVNTTFGEAPWTQAYSEGSSKLESDFAGMRTGNQSIGKLHDQVLKYGDRNVALSNSALASGGGKVDRGVFSGMRNQALAADTVVGQTKVRAELAYQAFKDNPTPATEAAARSALLEYAETARSTYAGIYSPDPASATASSGTAAVLEPGSGVNTTFGEAPWTQAYSEGSSKLESDFAGMRTGNQSIGKLHDQVLKYGDRNVALSNSALASGGGKVDRGVFSGMRNQALAADTVVGQTKVRAELAYQAFKDNPTPATEAAARSALLEYAETARSTYAGIYSPDPRIAELNTLREANVMSATKFKTDAAAATWKVSPAGDLPGAEYAENAATFQRQGDAHLRSGRIEEASIAYSQAQQELNKARSRFSRAQEEEVVVGLFRWKQNGKKVGVDWGTVGQWAAMLSPLALALLQSEQQDKTNKANWKREDQIRAEDKAERAEIRQWNADQRALYGGGGGGSGGSKSKPGTGTAAAVNIGGGTRSA